MDETTRNRQLIEEVFAALEARDPRPFADLLADDVVWRIPGCSAWSGSWEGKPMVQDMLAYVRGLLVRRVQLTVGRVLADGDHVVVTADGRAETTDGLPYDNAYCFVFRLADGKAVEITEYQDTDLAVRTLPVPATRD
jgi:uncharacterized protein